MSEIEITTICFDCAEKFDIDYAYIRCGECDDKREPIDDEYLINHLSKNDYIWKDKDGYVGFENEKELNLYLKGVEKGYKDCLFWLADYLGKVVLFENLEWK